MPHVTRIHIHPVKALDGSSVSSARISAAGTLEHDRDFALFDGDGRFVNGKANPAVHRLRSNFDFKTRCLTLCVQGSEARFGFHVDQDRHELESWLSDFFGFPVQFQYRPPRGFPDDSDAFGPTIISHATLVEIATWYPELALDDLRLRFRTNIEIDAAAAFWEDRLFDEQDSVLDFRVGSVHFQGINPCQRCVVPSRDPRSAEIYPGFQRIFAAKRQETLPVWANRSRFNHFYRLAVNTRIPVSEAGKEIHVGDQVRFMSES